uniref:Dynactin subunit 2 n=1 Tax=Loa loa TaxID=7209 RepID=A0A1I7VRT9_LOALO
MHDLHEILCTLTSIGDDVIAVDPITEPSQQLESIGQLTENLRKLKGKVEKVEEVAKFGRYEISLINESVQNYVNEMEQIPLQTVEEQNAALNEIETQLSSLQAIPMLISDEITISELDNRLHNININDADERNLDMEKITEKQNILHTIEEALDRLKDDRQIIEKRVNDMHAAEKMHEDGNHLYDELNALIKEGQEVLNDAEAVPTIYTTILDAFMSPLEAAAELLKRMAENEEMAMRLKATVKDARTLQTILSHHANLWLQFVDERDNATDQLETKRKPLDEMEISILDL